MAGYMIVGKYDCPWFAKACIIVDYLTEEDPTRKFTTIMKDSFEWQEVVDKLRRFNGWDIRKSPVVWEILIYPEGKGNLIGDIDDFCEYVCLVFGFQRHISTYEIELAVCRNKEAFGNDGSERLAANLKILNVSIIQPPIKILEFLLPQFLSPFPITDPNVLLNIRIYDTRTPARELQGLFFEVMDMASPHLYQITSSASLKQFFYDTHLVIMMEDLYQKRTEGYQEWLERVQKVCHPYAEAINVWAASSCKILVGSKGPQCFIAEVFRKYISLDKTPPGFIAAIGQHVVNRAKAELSVKSKIPSGSITRLHAWGWPGMTGAWVEIRDAVVTNMIPRAIMGPTPVLRPLSELAEESQWIFTHFMTQFLQKQKDLLAGKQEKMYTDMGIAEAIISTLHVWFESTRIIEDKRIKCPSNCPGQEEIRKDSTISLPVISVGIPPPKNSEFPEGSFLVQPAMCFMERWMPTGKISENFSLEIHKELARLWLERQHILHLAFSPTPDPAPSENFRGSTTEEEEDLEIPAGENQEEENLFLHNGDHNYEYDPNNNYYGYNNEYNNPGFLNPDGSYNNYGNDEVPPPGQNNYYHDNEAQENYNYNDDVVALVNPPNQPPPQDPITQPQQQYV